LLDEFKAIKPQIYGVEMIYLKYKAWTRGWIRMWSIRLAFFVAGGAFSGYVLSAVKPEQGWRDNVGTFTPWICEKTKGNGDEYPTGAERFLVTMHESIKALGLHMEWSQGIDAEASPSWHQETVWIDYKKNHEVCVRNMPGIYVCDKSLPHRAGDEECPSKGRKYSGDVTRCFDLYEIGER
jgi:hypothetical protein